MTCSCCAARGEYEAGGRGLPLVLLLEDRTALWERGWGDLEAPGIFWLAFEA